MTRKRVSSRNSKLQEEIIWKLISAAIMLLQELVRPHFDRLMDRLLRVSSEPKASKEPWYVVLGVSEDATSKEITSAYREQIIKNHPDKVAHLSKAILKTATEETQRLNKAYEESKIKKSSKSKVTKTTKKARKKTDTSNKSLTRRCS
jgi:preprotein translocase subunit Sec63